MNTVFLDTNIINICYDNGVSGKELSCILNQNSLKPVVGMYVIYEVARIFSTNNISKARELFLVIKELQPLFVCKRDQLYVMEYEKLLYDEPVEYFSSQHHLNDVIRIIDRFIRGEVTNYDLDFISLRQNGLNNLETAWVPTGMKKVIFEQFNNNFALYLSHFFSDIINNQEKIDSIVNCIEVSTDGYVKLTELNLFNLIKNISSFPALRALIYSNLYIGYLTEIDRIKPKEDRFTDSLVLIEASYCTAFLSNDQTLINKHAININPAIQLINLNDIVQLNRT